MCCGSRGQASKDPAARDPDTPCSTLHPSHRGACYSLMSGGGGKRNEERHDGNAVSGSGSVVEVSKRQRRMTVRLSQSGGSRTTLTMVGEGKGEEAATARRTGRFFPQSKTVRRFPFGIA